MFKILRYFSFYSLVGFLIVTAVLAIFYRHTAIDNLLKMEESNNVALTQAFANSLWPQFASFVLTSSSHSGDELRAHPEIEMLGQAAITQIQGTSVIKIKIYNTSGLTVFSTQASQIGEDKSDNSGYLSALNGQVASELSHRDSFSSFEKVIVDRDVISSYIPIRPAGLDGPVEAVFEVYSDVTELLEHIVITQRNIFAGVIFILSLLYTALFLTVRHATLIVQQQYTERTRAEQALQQAKEGLELKVLERTAELSTASDKLRLELTERERIENDLRRSEERYMLAAKGSNDGLWDWDLISQEIYYSPRWLSMVGLQDQKNGKDNQRIWFSRIHPDDLDRVRSEIENHLDGITPHFQSEFRMLNQDGAYRWMYCRGLAIRNRDGKVYRMAGSQTDITLRKETEEQLLHNAFHDTLTSLPNRALFMDRLSRSFERSKRLRDYLFAVLFLDLDHFKLVNDSLGHAIGDELLVGISQRLGFCLRSADTLARLGGDEFAILLDEISDISDATRVAQRIQQELSTAFELNGHEVFSAVSIGIALNIAGYDNPEDILRDADTAMYRAKSQGRSRYQIFDKTMHSHAMTRMQIETDLRRALERKEFCLYYQPIISLKNQYITGFETLVRWQHPTRGLIPPGDFIPIAEETGLIQPLDLYVLRGACHQMSLWLKSYPSHKPLSISVNLSGKHFSDPNLISQIDQILEETGLSAGNLEIEITENALIDNAETATTILEMLKSRGIRLHMDDFGTGYSSLSYLYRFPFHSMKIDQTFISKVSQNDDASKIVQAVVKLAKNLGMGVIAEGIETEDELNYLKSLNCEQGQGYLFSKPVDSQAAERLLLLSPA